jgi:hypothetical protein
MLTRSRAFSAAWQERLQRGWTSLFPRCHEFECARAARGWRSRLRFQGVWFANSWYCTADCLERAAVRAFTRLRVPAALRRGVTHRLPLGLLMLSRGLVSHAQLQAALEAQRQTGEGRIGDWLIRLGFVGEQDVTRTLAQQWSCPRVNMTSPVPARVVQMLPWTLVEYYRMLPVHYVERRRALHVAFAGPPEYAVLYAAEQMLDCHTEACVVTGPALEAQLRRARQLPRTAEVSFETVTEAAEMARVVRSYVLRLGVTEVRLASCGEHAWVRLLGSAHPTNLLFRTANRTDEDKGFPAVTPGLGRGDAIKFRCRPADDISRQDDEQLSAQFAQAAKASGHGTASPGS